MKVIDKTPDEGAPSELDMHDHDARHAVMADPDRYEIVPKTTAEQRAEQRARMSPLQRIAALEAIIDKLTALDEDEEDAPPPAPAGGSPAPALGAAAQAAAASASGAP